MSQAGKLVLRTGLLIVLLYCFFVGLDLMGLAFKLFGKGFAETLIENTANPFIGLFIGILATTLLQSSSSTTTMTVGLVAAGALTVEGAVPIIMGANIGTSVTNTLVSLAHVTRREEFRRAFAGATVHDFFNWLTVLILLPVEVVSGYLARTSAFLESVLEGVGGIELFNPIRAMVQPAAQFLAERLGSSGVLVLIVGVMLLFVALRSLVGLLRVVLSGRAERILHNTLFRSAFVALLAGTGITVMVQSSSITTSIVIPLVAAGVVSLEQVFPYTLGANIGTTVTAILAALSTGNPAAVSVALSHLLFNVTGVLIVYGIPPIRALPLKMARIIGGVASRNRTLAVAYVAVLFYGLPLLLILLNSAFGKTTEPKGQQSQPAPTSASTLCLDGEEGAGGIPLQES